MSDDLLDEATRLADRHTAGYRETGTSRIVRALVERVQQAEAERDAARGKLDKVREYVRQHDETAEMGREQWGADVLATLEEEP